MDYFLQEGRLTLPAGFQDRTVNVFIPGNQIPAPFSFTVARDTTLPDEVLADYVERQLGMLAAKLRKYRHQGTSEVVLGAAPGLAGLQIDAQYQNDGRTVYQRQAAFPLGSDRTLVFSATCQSAFDAHLNQLWADLLASFQPHPPATPQP